MQVLVVAFVSDLTVIGMPAITLCICLHSTV